MDWEKVKNMRRKPGVLAMAVKDNTAELLIYDVIGGDFWDEGVTAKDVVQKMQALPENVDTILVRINSPGGSVFDGVAIMNALVTFKGTVNVQIDGLCASAASTIAMAGKTITMSESAMLMIHNPWTIALGDANDMRAAADHLDQVRAASMLTAYARSGKSQDEIIAIMDAETWYNAEQAKEAGWIDAIIEMPTNNKAAAKAKFDLSAFKHPPKEAGAKPAKKDPAETEHAEVLPGNDPNALAATVAALVADAMANNEAEKARKSAEEAENARISAEIEQIALIRAQKRAANLRLAADS